jgi:hypothetical protein
LPTLQAKKKTKHATGHEKGELFFTEIIKKKLTEETGEFKWLNTKMEMVHSDQTTLHGAA